MQHQFNAIHFSNSIMFCNATLLSQDSKVTCVAGRTFGCVNDRTMWTRRCRGVFRCANVQINCGYSRPRQYLALKNGRRIECSCSSKCAESVMSVAIPPKIKLTKRSRTNVALVMYETRELLRGTYWSLTAALNERYATNPTLSLQHEDTMSLSFAGSLCKTA